MPLTQAEMDFFTRHAYELHNFDRPTPAHDFLRALYTSGYTEGSGSQKGFPREV